jgi:putative transposase
MKGKRFSQEQIIYALKRVEGGEKPREVCRQMGVSEPAFYAWRKKYSGMGVSELNRLRQLQEENHRLKRLVADLSRDKHILQEVVAKKL